MERWQFLIQKEGDRVWTNLNPTTKLKEGRYRIVAHSSEPDFEAEIRIVHQPEDPAHSCENTQTYFRRTNSQGLMMIFPFTHLEPGTWEIRCREDLMSELLGKGWQQKVKLEIVSGRESFKKKQQFKTEIKPKKKNVVPPVNKNEKNVNYAEKLEMLLREKIEPVLRSYQAHTSTGLTLTLNQDTFVRTQGESILIAGQVDIQGDIGLEKISVINGRIRYEIREENTDKVLLTYEETIEEGEIPFVFNYNLEIPEEIDHPFVLGDVILETFPDGNTVRKSFNITTDLNPVYSRPVNYTITLSTVEANQDFAFDLLLDEQALNSSLNVDLPEPKKLLKYVKFAQPSSGQVLPPKIHNGVSNEQKSLQLPQIKRNQPPAAEAEIEVTVGEIEDKTNVSVEQAFEALDLEQRFLSRLNSLAQQ